MKYKPRSDERHTLIQSTNLTHDLKTSNSAVYNKYSMCFSLQKDILDVLLDTLDKVQSGLLRDRQVDSGPVSVHAGSIGLLVNR